MRAPVRVNPSCQIPPRPQCVLGNRWFLWLSKAPYPDMPLRSPSWALIDRRGYQPWLRREDPSLLWPFEAGVGVRSQNPEDNDAGFCFLLCGLVELLSGVLFGCDGSLGIPPLPLKRHEARFGALMHQAERCSDMTVFGPCSARIGTCPPPTEVASSSSSSSSSVAFVFLFVFFPVWL